MKKVKLAVVTTIDGKRFRVPSRGEDGEPITQDGRPVMKDAELPELIRLFVFAIPTDRLTMEDSIHAHRLIGQMETKRDGHLEFEDAEHSWLVKKIEDYGPKVFALNACQLKDALDNFERVNEPKAKK